MAEVKIIYSDGNFQDIGILKDYKLDLAYGADENTFELTMPISQAVLQVGYYIYNEDDGNIGGRVTKMQIDTANNTIKYKGDTWHGILTKHIVEPPTGQGYRVMSGGADRVIYDLLEVVGMASGQSIFIAYDTDRSGIDIASYPIRYGDVYTVLTDMLYQHDAKLRMDIEFDGRWYVRLSAEKLVNYANDEEWNSSQRNFVAEKYYQPVNHMICLGSGDLQNRRIIHLFSDGAKIMPYSTVDNPVRDSQYILDKRNQMLFGVNENAIVYDYPNAQLRKGYVRLVTKPSDWESNYSAYYYYTDDGYKPFEGVPRTDYRILGNRPTDWDSNAVNYYLLIDGEYKRVGDTDDYYVLLSVEPVNWEDAYHIFYRKEGSDYINVMGIAKFRWASRFIYLEDEITWNYDWLRYFEKIGENEYQALPTHTEYEYSYVGNVPPDDWNTNYKNYYMYRNGEYVRIQDVQKVINGEVFLVKPNFYEIDRVYRQISQAAPPRFEDYMGRELYYQYSYTGAPAWEIGTFYDKRIIDESPTFYPNTFYQRVDYVVAPTYGVAYEYVDDNYADLVENALKRFNDYLNCDKINITLSPSEQYDIGDIVGATDDVTGLSVVAPITKKIVKISKNRKTVSYETGGGRA